MFFFSSNSISGLLNLTILMTWHASINSSHLSYDIIVKFSVLMIKMNQKCKVSNAIKILTF